MYVSWTEVPYVSEDLYNVLIKRTDLKFGPLCLPVKGVNYLILSPGR